MKNRMKKLVAMALGTAMLLGANVTPVYASNEDPSRAYENLGGITANAYVVFDTMSATAGTGFSGYGGTCKATARVYYWYDNTYYYSETTNSTAQPGSISTTTTKKKGGADVIGGKGIHRVTYKDIIWTPTTFDGNVNVSAKKL